MGENGTDYYDYPVSERMEIDENFDFGQIIFVPVRIFIKSTLAMKQ